MMTSEQGLLSADQIASIEAKFDSRLRRVDATSKMLAEHVAQRCRDHNIVMPILLPGRFMMELSAALELGLWQKSGQVPEILLRYPDSQILVNRLWQEWATGRFRDQGVPPSSLPRALDRAWSEASCWDAIAVLGVPILVQSGDIDDEQMVDRLAEILWNHRHLCMPRESFDASKSQEAQSDLSPTQ